MFRAAALAGQILAEAQQEAEEQYLAQPEPPLRLSAAPDAQPPQAGGPPRD